MSTFTNIIKPLVTLLSNGTGLSVLTGDDNTKLSNALLVDYQTSETVEIRSGSTIEDFSIFLDYRTNKSARKARGESNRIATFDKVKDVFNNNTSYTDSVYKWHMLVYEGPVYDEDEDFYRWEVTITRESLTPC